MLRTNTVLVLLLGLPLGACNTGPLSPPPNLLVDLHDRAVPEVEEAAPLPSPEGRSPDGGDSPEREKKLRLRRDRLHLRGGAQFLGNFATGISVNGQDVGTDIDLENDLGFDSDVFTGRADFDWRLGERHHIIGSWYGIERGTSFDIDEEISFDDVVFQVGANLQGLMDLDVIRLGYRYDVWRDRRTEVGVSIGAHTMLVDFQLSGVAEVDGMGPPVDATRSARAAAPLPVLGTYLSWAVADRWQLYVTNEFFVVKFDQFEGALIDNQIVIEYQIMDQVALGVGYNRFLIDMTISDDSFRGDLEYTYNGLLFFLSTWF